jgi:large subunit ribosomal protein L22
VKINGPKLTNMALAKGVSIEKLAEAVERTGLSGDRAVSAIGNWMRNSDHPRCKREDIANLANALGCQMGEIVTFQSVFKFHRGSPRKCKLLVDLIRNKRVDVAENLLTFTTKRAAVDVKKALLAAREEAASASADMEQLYVTVSMVGAGPVIKRFQPKDRGRAHPILKRMSHITVALEQRLPGEKKKSTKSGKAANTPAVKGERN